MVAVEEKEKQKYEQQKELPVIMVVAVEHETVAVEK